MEDSTKKKKKKGGVSSKKDGVKNPLKILERTRLDLRRKIIKERKEEDGLKVKIEQLKKQIDAKRKRMGQYRAMMSLEQAFKAKKDITDTFRGAELGKSTVVRENKLMLDKALNRLRTRSAHMRVAINEETEENAKLRRTINALRHERNVFNRVFKNLETELQKEKGKIEQNASKIELSYETRDKAQMLMNELSEDFDTEKTKWLREWRELGQQLSLNKELEDAKKTNEDEFKLGTMSMEEEMELKSSLWRRLWGMGKTTASKNMEEERLAELEAMWGRMKEATGVEDLDSLISAFVQMENENFRRIQFSAETTKELREVQQDYETLRRTKETMLAEKALSTKTRENILSSIESQTNIVSAAVAEVEMEHKHHLDYVNKAVPLVEDLCNELGFDGKSGIALSLGTSSPVSPESKDGGRVQVTPDNLMEHLGDLESHINQIVRLYIGLAAEVHKNPVRASPMSKPSLQEAKTKMVLNALSAKVENIQDNDDELTDDVEVGDHPMKVRRFDSLAAEMFRVKMDT